VLKVKIFDFAGSYEEIEGRIEDWLVGKNIVSVTQSENENGVTVLIIAEENDREE
jgi:hypothetical protein